MELTNLHYLGLTDAEIRIYQVLLENGPLSAARIVQLTGLKKGDTYNKIYDLIEKKLVEEYEEKKKKHFRLLNPRHLEELTAAQYQTALQAKREVEAVLTGILSTYTLTHHQPGIILFEGEEAVRRTLDDSLSAETDILQYVDSESIDDYLAKYDADYVRQRLKLQKKKRILMADTPAHRHYAANQKTAYQAITEIRFIPENLASFKTSMQIYNNKISYLTLKPDTMIGVIIEDPLISLMHRELFEFTWQQVQSQTLSGSHQVQPGQPNQS